MNQADAVPVFLCELFPRVSDDLLALDAVAAGEGGLLHSDFCTVRDLLELSGYEDDALHALLIILLLALDAGSLCVELSAGGLTRHLTHLLSPEAATMWAERIVTAFSQHDFAALIGPAGCIDRPILLRQARGQTLLYFQKYLAYESLLRPLLHTRLKAFAAEADVDNLRIILNEVLVERPPQRAGQPLTLNRDQRLALGVVLLRNFTIISGGPGTGKTSVVFSLVRCLLRAGVAADRIVLAAPTGRAAQRLTDSLRAGLNNLPGWQAGPDSSLAQLSASTLHSLLGYQPTRDQFRHHVENPLPADVVIVDEASMVGLRLIAQLFQATEPTTKIILLGDKDQLPSVEAGAILARLTPQDARPGFGPAMRRQLAAILPDVGKVPEADGELLDDTLVLLDENYRSRQDIQEIARAINGQDTTVVERLPRFMLPAALPTMDVVPDPPVAGSVRPGSFAELEQLGGCWLLDGESATLHDWRRLLLRWAEHLYLTPDAEGVSYLELANRVVLPTGAAAAAHADLERLFVQVNKAKILTLIREGPWGCNGINEIIAAHLRGHIGRSADDERFAGAPVLLLRNDHIRGLFNGDIGLALRRADGGYAVVFPRHEGYLTLPIEALPAHELAFALTVHKSQGSEYGQVLLVLPPEGGRRLLTREMVYTGITRARELALLCAPAAVLCEAIARRIERDDGLWDLSAAQA